MIARMTKRLETVSLALPMALLLGLSLAFALFAMPGHWLGRAIGMSGLPALIHAATPPLGDKARMLIALAGGLAGGAVVWALFRRLERPVTGARAAMTAHARASHGALAEPVEQGELMAAPDAVVAAEPPVAASPEADEAPEPVAPVAVPAETAVPAADAPDAARPWLRWLPVFTRRAEPGTDGAPVLRRADAHPDAPARRPIFAAADLGAPLDAGGAAWAANEVAEAPPEAAWAPHEAEPAAVQQSAAALMARLDAALAARPGRPASPPAAGAALREAMAELRRTRHG